MGQGQKESQRMMQDVEAQVRDVLAQMGVSADVAARAGEAVRDLLWSEWGGIEIYIPKRTNYEIAKKHEQVRVMAESPGTTPNDVCRRFRISRRQYSRILKKGT